MKRRILALLLTLCMLASTCSAPAFAEETEAQPAYTQTENTGDAQSETEDDTAPTDGDTGVTAAPTETPSTEDAANSEGAAAGGESAASDDSAASNDSAAADSADTTADGENATPDAASEMPAPTESASPVDQATADETANVPSANDQNTINPLATNNDVTPPVFEDVQVRYDAASNKLYFDVQAYDAESKSLRIELCFCDSNGVRYYSYLSDISTNPCTLEYDASQLQNGTYSMCSIWVNDGTNETTAHFAASGFIEAEKQIDFDVTNSPFTKDFTLKNVTPDVESITVNKGEVKEFHVVVELNGDTSKLIKDPDHNNRIGTISYSDAVPADLLLNEQGQIVATCSVDWLISRFTLYVEDVAINVSNNESIYPKSIYHGSNEYGTIRFENTANNINKLPIASLIIVDKATGESVTGKTYDTTNGQDVTLQCTLTLQETIELPTGVTLSASLFPQNGSRYLVSFDLTKQSDTVYVGERNLRDCTWSTQYVCDTVFANRGPSGHGVARVPGIVPHFIVKTGDNVVINTHTTTVHVEIGLNTAYANTITTEGYAAKPLQELLGGAENYDKLVAQTKREKGDTCEGWLVNDTFYIKDDLVPIGRYSSDNLYIAPAYANYTITPTFTFVGANMEPRDVEMPERTITRGTTRKDVFDQCQTETDFPQLPTIEGVTFLNWDDTSSMVNTDGYLSYRAQYSKPWASGWMYAVDETCSYYAGNSRCFFYDATTTAADYMAQLPAPSVVPAGYKFLSWEIVSGSKYYYWDSTTQKGTAADWTKDILISKAYSVPDVYATYEKTDPNAAPLPEPPVITYPDDPTPPTPDEPKGVTLPEEVVNTTVTEIEKAIEDAKTTGEKPAPIHIDMTQTENSEEGAVATVIPVEVLEAIQDTDVDVVLDMGDYSWTVSGQDVAAVNLKNVNLEVKLVEDVIPSQTVESLAGGADTQQITLTHNGNFGFRADLTINLGADKAGQYGNIYYYNSNQQLVFMDAGLVDSEGNVTLSFSHASDYVVVFDDTSARIPGDFNGDGKVNSRDVMQLQMSIVDLRDPFSISVTDFTGDGKVNSRDVLRLQMYIVGLVDTLYAK